VLAVVALPTTATTPAAAAGVCGGTRGNYFNGYFQDGKPNYQFEGSSGYIVVRDGANCTGDTSIGNFSNAWLMIASNLGAPYNGWGQVGFERTAGFPLRWFSQFYDGYKALETRYSTFPVSNQIGVRHTFRVLWYESCLCLRATIDSTTWAESDFNPFAYPAESNWGPQAWSPQFLAEAGYLQSDVPGTPAARTRFSSLGAQRVSDDRLILMPCVLSGTTDNPTRWARQASSCNAFDVWTK
jgi:hypothetical protein